MNLTPLGLDPEKFIMEHIRRIETIREKLYRRLGRQTEAERDTTRKLLRQCSDRLNAWNAALNAASTQAYIRRLAALESTRLQGILDD